MTVRAFMRVGMLSGALLCYAVAGAQTPAPQPPKKAALPAKPVRVGTDKLPPAPQVVTIVHRLNVLQMFRLLLRYEEQAQSIAGLDSAFNLKDHVHTNVIAGLAMDDGETIAAWLPEADVEFGPRPFPPTPPRAQPGSPRWPADAFPVMRDNLFEEPDVTVIGPD